MNEEVAAGKEGIACQIDTQTTEAGLVARGRDMGQVDFETPEFRQFFHCELGCGVGHRADAERNQHFFHIEAGIFLMEKVFFHCRDGLGDGGGKEVNFVWDTGEVFNCVKDQA